MNTLKLTVAAGALTLTGLATGTVTPAPAAAQTLQDQFEVSFQARETQRRATISTTMAFTEEEAANFWPIYDQYRLVAKGHQLRRMRMVATLSENTVGMDEATAATMIKNALDLEAKQQAAKKTYINQLTDHFFGARHFRLYQLETKLDALFRFGWTKQIPLAVTEDELKLLQQGFEARREAEREAAEKAAFPTT